MAELESFTVHRVYVQNNTGQAGGIPKLDLNVEPAWALGYTGKGVTTGIMDDGIDYMHPDLEDNFVRSFTQFLLKLLLKQTQFLDIV